MEVRNSFALKKKQELLGSHNKRKMSLRKYMDNLKQNECRLDITQITKCVFLGSLFLKPVPQLFDSPLLLQELDMKVGSTDNSVNNIQLNNENVEITLIENGIPKEKSSVKKKCLSTSKTKKKTPREKSELKNMYNGINNNVKNENIKLEEVNENRLEERSSSPEEDFEDDERIKKEATPELIISDDETIDQLMYNIMDIKIGTKDFFEMSASDIESYEKLSTEFTVTDKFDPPSNMNEAEVVNENENLEVESPTKEKKMTKRTPQCKICSQVFSNYMKLKKHKMTHNGEKPYHCLKCGENHTSLDHLIAHLRTHQGKRPYVCRKCNKGFKTAKALENHQPVHVLKKEDLPKKVFRCEVCLKEFRKLCDLERHTRVHTGEKPSVCNICNRRFQQAHNLNKHLLIHTKEKPFQCDICNKKFGRSDVLNRHVLTHSLKKPNHCETCMKSFIRVSQLMAHKEKYHPNKSS